MENRIELKDDLETLNEKTPLIEEYFFEMGNLQYPECEDLRNDEILLDNSDCCYDAGDNNLKFTGDKNIQLDEVIEFKHYSLEFPIQQEYFLARLVLYMHSDDPDEKFICFSQEWMDFDMAKNLEVNNHSYYGINFLETHTIKNLKRYLKFKENMMKNT